MSSVSLSNHGSNAIPSRLYHPAIQTEPRDRPPLYTSGSSYTAPAATAPEFSAAADYHGSHQSFTDSLQGDNGPSKRGLSPLSAYNPLPTVPEYEVEYRIASPFGFRYSGPLNSVLFDTVAGNLNLDNEDVSRVRVTLQDPPPTLRKEFRTHVILRAEAGGMDEILKTMSTRAARKLALLEVKREEGARMVYVVEDVPPKVKPSREP